MQVDLKMVQYCIGLEKSIILPFSVNRGQEISCHVRATNELYTARYTRTIVIPVSSH